MRGTTELMKEDDVLGPSFKADDSRIRHFGCAKKSREIQPGKSCRAQFEEVPARHSGGSKILGTSKSHRYRPFDGYSCVIDGLQKTDFSMSKQELFAINQRPCHIFPGFAAILGLSEVFKKTGFFGSSRFATER